MKDKYNPIICKPLFGAVLGGDKLIYELRKININCLDCSNYDRLNYCLKADELEKKASDLEKKLGK